MTRAIKRPVAEPTQHAPNCVATSAVPGSQGPKPIGSDVQRHDLMPGAGPSITSRDMNPIGLSGGDSWFTE